MDKKVIITEWENCYPSNWKGVITPEAMAHPAKYSSKLIRRIYEHMIEMGWLKAGDKVVDPFGGVALGALDAMRLGLHWYGVELELKFAGLGNVNILEWNNRFGNMPRWGSAHLFNGDSRKLIDVIQGKVSAAVSSPPYADSDQNYKAGWERFHDGHEPLHANDIQREAEYGATPGQLSAMPAGNFKAALSSPPYAEMDLQYKKNGLKVDGKEKYERPYMEGQGEENYGSAPGQLGAMKATGFDAAISSPPFLQSEGGAHVPSHYAEDPTFMKRHAAGNKSSNAYGESDGQLSSMKDGGFDAAVSSPPYAELGSGKGRPVSSNYEGYGERSSEHGREINPAQLGAMEANNFDASISSPPYDETRVGKESGQEHCGNGDQYGETDGQLGGADDFWLAARAIVEQVYQALEPGGHAVWVVKDYVKTKKIVPFCDQWRQLCEAVGFVTEHEHHAMLVHHKGTQHTLDGGQVERKTESKSFFRRLAEKKGSPRIDWETIFCMTKL
jgi:hypothetical protein